MDKIQETIGTWGDETFPNATTENVIDHLREEVDEVRADNANLEEETADIAILAIQIAHKNGFSLEQAILKKHEKNTQRTWKKNDKGYWNHEKVIEHYQPAGWVSDYIEVEVYREIPD